MWYEATEIREYVLKSEEKFTLIKIKDFAKSNSTKPKIKF